MKGIVNRRASKKVTSFYRNNWGINRLISNMKIKTVADNSEKKGGNNDVK